MFDAANNLVKTFSSKPDKELKQAELKLKQGMNEATWDMRYEGADTFDKLILWGGGTQGPRAVPGTFKAVLTLGDQTQEVNFEIVKDPRATASLEDLQSQFEFLVAVRDKLTETHKTIKKLRDVPNSAERFAGPA